MNDLHESFRRLDQAKKSRKHLQEIGGCIDEIEIVDIVIFHLSRIVTKHMVRLHDSDSNEMTSNEMTIDEKMEVPFLFDIDTHR